MNKLTKNSFFSRALNADKTPGSVSAEKNTTYSTTKQPAASYEAFKEHWKHATQIFSKSLINDEDVQVVKNHLNQMVNLLLDELNNPNNYLSLKPLASFNNNHKNDGTDYGPIWNYLFRANIFEVVFLWSLSYPEYLFDLKFEQLKYYENLVYQMQTNEQTHLLLNDQIHRPLFSLLNHCSTHNSEKIEKVMISILNQLCVCICKNSELLEIFFHQAKMVLKENTNSLFYINDVLNDTANSPYKFTTHFSTNKQYMKPTSTAKFFIFSLLIPYIHKEGALGQQARDALLMIMQLSMRNPNLARYIVDCTDFCPILATGLSGLYSELPQKLTSSENFEEIRYLKKEDIVNILSLNKFINSLEFCNNVIQVSHSLIANQLLQYVYYGFLIPVVAPALTQNCIEEIVAATAYLDLFLRTVNEPNLRKIFLKFILYAKFDEKMTLLDTLIGRINSNNKLSLVTLMLFYTMIDFNSEDVMYKLILVHLMPCNHIMKSQISTLKQNSYEINGINAKTFLSFATNYDKPVWIDNNNSHTNTTLLSVLNQREALPFSTWFYSLFESKDLTNTISFLDGSHFNFVDYLKDAHQGILCSTHISRNWSYSYDTSHFQSGQAVNTTDSSQTAFKFPSHELEYDAEEYLLNLNIFTSSITDPISKSSRNTENIFDSNNDKMKVSEDEQGMISRKGSVTGNSMTSKIRSKSKRKSKKSSKMHNNDLNSPSSTPVDNSQLSTSDNNEKRPRRIRQRRTRNDFYFLSFDNELSDSGSSSSEADIEGTETKTQVKTQNINASNYEDHDVDDEDYDDDGGDLTSSMTSRSSSLTVNNEGNSQVFSNYNEDDCELMNSENRKELIDFLFSNQQNNQEFLNGNLSSFMTALDTFFSQKKIILSAEDQKRKINNDVNSVCDQILSVYNELITLQKSIPCSEITHFPIYEENTDKMNTNSQNSINMEGEPVVACYTEEASTIDDNARQVTPGTTGPFLMAVFGRLEHMLSNPLQINFLLTGIIARLAYYPQLLLRSFLLNQNLVVQPNVQTLIQVLATIKYKIEACKQSFNNFPLLYFKAKVCLVKRITQSRIKQQKQQHANSAIDNSTNKNTDIQQSKPITEIRFRDVVRKKSTFDRFINFFKSEEEKILDIKFDSSSSKADEKPRVQDPNVQSMINIGDALQASCEVEMDLKQAKSVFTRNPQMTMQNDDYKLVEAEWESLETRNIAYSAVIFDEFVKEMAAICQEHGLSTKD